jgi:hypothetical protein
VARNVRGGSRRGKLKRVPSSLVIGGEGTTAGASNRGYSDEELERTERAMVWLLDLLTGLRQQVSDPALKDLHRWFVQFAIKAPLPGHEDEFEAVSQPFTPAESTAARFMRLVALSARENVPDPDEFAAYVELASELCSRFVRYEDGGL